MKKRFLSMLLAVCLLVGLLPTAALAEGGTSPAFTATDGTDGVSGEGYEKLFDSDSATKWCVTDFDSDDGAYVIFKASEAMKVTGYSITTGNDNVANPGRNPESWALYGYTGSGESNSTSTDWESIDSVTNDTVLQDENYTKYFFEVTGQTTAYQYFKLEISAIESGDVMQMSEFTLTSCVHTWVEGNTISATCTTKGYTEYICSQCDAAKIGDVKSPLGHDFSGAGGACTRCGKTKAELYTFDVSKGRVIIADDEYSGKLLVYYFNGTGYEKAEGYIDPSETITVTGTTTEYELHVVTTTPVTIKAKDLKIDRSAVNGAYAMSLDTSGAKVTLILEGENSFAGGSERAGISVDASRTLTIQGDGSLTATGGSSAADIGNNQGNTGGTIIINGNAWVNASNISGTLTLTNGVVNGTVYGNVTLTADRTITDLTIPAGATLTIPEGKTLTNNGTLTNSGAIYVDGTLSGSGTLTNSGTVYYPLTLTNCTATGDGVVTRDGKTYAAKGTSVTLTATLPKELVTGWTVTGVDGASTDSSYTNTITMPANAVTATANLAPGAAVVSNEAELKTAITNSATYIKLTADITLSETLGWQGKQITLDLNGHILKNTNSNSNVFTLSDKTGKTSLTLIDSNPTATHEGLPYKGGVIDGKIELTSDGHDGRECHLYANGGTVTGSVSLNSYAGHIYCTSDTPTAFYGDAVSNSGGSIYGGMYYGSIRGDNIQIKGKTVTFKDDGSIYARQVVEANVGKVVAPIEPTKAGYTFLGWYNGESKYTFGSTVNDDITLEAKWEPIPATAPTVGTLDGLTLTYGYTEGNVLTVSATAAEDANYTLSYQWYSNTTNSNFDGTSIDGATGNSYTVPAGKIAGTTEYYYCVVTATRKDNGDTASNTSNAATVTVNRASISPVVSIEDWTYGDTAKNPSVTGNLGEGTVIYTYKLQNAADGTYTDTVPTAAGSYTVKASVAQTVNYASGTATKDFTISPKDITVSITPNGGCYGSVTPASAKLNGLVEGDDVAVTLTYKGTANDGTSYNSTDAPTKAGSYTVTASISDPNYNLTGTVTANFVIDKAEQDAPAAPVVKSKTWHSVTLKDIADSTESGAKVQYSIDGGITWQDSPVFTRLKSATKYSFVARYVETDNYYASPASQPVLVITNNVPASTYPPTVEQPDEGGSVDVSTNNPAQGDTVTITPKPEEGYEVDKVIVTDRNGNPVEVTDNGDGTYSFKQPSSKVTVTVTFKEKTRIVFVDVPASAYYYDAVYWAVENGVTTGTGDGTTFSPNDPCTRAQAVTFLWRAAGCPAPKSTEMPFVDVAKGSYYYDAVLWAVEQGITNGTSDTTFSPNNTCTRAQIVTFLWRSQKSPSADSVNPFADVAADAYYADAVLWAVKEDITNGTSSTTFSPDATCTRAQIVTFLWRTLAE